MFAHSFLSVCSSGKCKQPWMDKIQNLLSLGSPHSQAIRWSELSTGAASASLRSLTLHSTPCSAPSNLCLSCCCCFRRRSLFLFLFFFFFLFLAAAAVGCTGLVVSGPTWLTESSRLDQVDSLAEIAVPRASKPCSQELAVLNLRR